MTRILFFILVLALLASFGNQGWLKLYHLRRVEQSRMADNRYLDSENDHLKSEIERLKTAEYLEHLIRNDLGFVRDNEVIYEISTPGRSQAP